jgi:4'-phosphopantetheinyl transferase
MAELIVNNACTLIRWPVGSKPASLGPANVHVLTAPLDLAGGRLDEFAGTLSADELERAHRFRFARHRNRFIAGRGLLRAVLAEYLGCAPEGLRFSYSPFGKPCLSGPFASSGLEFNLAHSQDLALLAVTRAGAIGVDLERVRVLEDAAELVNRFFSPNESALFRRLPDDQKPAAFFNLWTRKEAWLKATGEGIGQYLNGVEVSFLPEEPARLLKIPAHLDHGISWRLHTLTPADGFAAALAIAAETFTVGQWAWMEPLPRTAPELRTIER